MLSCSCYSGRRGLNDASLSSMSKALVLSTLVLLAVVGMAGAANIRHHEFSTAGEIDPNSFGQKLLKNLDVLSLLQESGMFFGKKDMTESKFADCEDVGAAQEEDPLLKAYRKRYKAAFDAGAYVIGVTDAKLSKADLTLEYVNEDLKSVFKITGKDHKGAKQVECRGEKYKAAHLTIVLYGVMLEAKEKGYMFNEIPINEITLDTDIVVDVTAHYNEKKSDLSRRAAENSNKPELAVFDVNDYRYNKEKNEVRVCMTDLEPTINFKSAFLSVVTKIFKGVVKKKTKAIMGYSFKCYMQNQQPLLVGNLVHRAHMKYAQINKLIDECTDGVCEKETMGQIERLTGLSSPSLDEAAKKNLASKPRMNIAFTLTGRYGEDHAQIRTDGLDSHVIYNTIFEMTLPTSDTLVMFSDTTTDALQKINSTNVDAFHNSHSDDDDDPDTINYVHVLMKEWFESNMIDIGQLQSLIEFAKQSSIDPETRLGIYARGIDMEINSITKGRSDADFKVGSADVNIELPKDSRFPMKLWLLSSQYQRNDEYIIALCKKKHPNAVAQCVKQGRMANKEHVQISTDTVKSLIGDDSFHLTGKVNGGAKDLHLMGPLDRRFWIKLVQSQCAVDGQMCKRAVGLFGQYLTEKQSYFQFKTADTVTGERGIAVDKFIISFNIINKFNGPMNLGKMIGVMLNTRGYLKQAAKERRKLKDWNYSDQLGLAIDPDRIEEAQHKKKDYWARLYRRDMHKFLEGLPEGPPPLPGMKSKDSGSSSVSAGEL